MQYLTASAILFVCLAGLATVKGADIQEEIFSGSTAQRGQFPYIAFTEVFFRSEGTALCSGSLIAPSWVLTAAHCVEEAKSAKILLGVVDKQNLTGGVQAVSSKIYSHPKYNADTFVNDIALYRLSEPVPLDMYPYISVIALPKLSQAGPDSFNNYEVVSSGWGSINNKGELSRYLLYARQHVLDHDKCRSIYAQILEDIPITDGMLCTDRNTTNRSGPCPGDSGGPVATKGPNGKPLLVGVTSWGSPKCNTTDPDVLTNVAQYLPWINGITKIPIS